MPTIVNYQQPHSGAFQRSVIFGPELVAIHYNPARITDAGKLCKLRCIVGTAGRHRERNYLEALGAQARFHLRNGFRHGKNALTPSVLPRLPQRKTPHDMAVSDGGGCICTDDEGAGKH